MAISISKTYHARSNSFPSKYHPVAITVEDKLCRLKSCHTTSSISKNLENLKDVHESLNDLIELPLIQQECCDTWTYGVLDGSIGLLDVCSSTKDIMVDMKECVKELESSLRRNRGGESNITDEISAFNISRRSIKKKVNKCIQELKRFERMGSASLVKQDRNLVPSLAMLQESEVISFSVLKSLLLNISKQRGWSFMSKVMQSTQDEVNVTDIQKIDDSLSALVSQIRHGENKVVQVQNVLNQLKTLEITFQDIEDGLETIFRSLIKRRVSLLNAINH